MSTNNYTKISSQSWFSRIGHSLKGTIIGFLLLLGAIILIWWNEGRAVRTARGLEEGIENVVVLKKPLLAADNNGKLIHFHGEFFVADSLFDDEFNIAVEAIKLKRIVEMYQWKETSKTTSQKKVGGGKEQVTEYTYIKEWSSSLIDADQFEIVSGHENPDQFPIVAYEENLSDVFIGDFSMTPEILSQVNEYEYLKLTSSNCITSNGTVIKETDSKDQLMTQIYIGKGTKNNPEIGDVKVSFQIIPIREYSIIALQESGTLKPYPTESGTEIILVSLGNISANDMFKNALTANNVLTWGLRFFGLILMFISLSLMGQLIETVTDIVPILGSIAQLGVKLFASVISFFLTTMIIGFAWIYYRPLLGSILILIGLSIALFFYKKSLDKKSV